MAKKLLIFADGDVGIAIVSWLAKYHHNNIALIFTISDNEISKICKNFGIETVIFSCFEKVIAEISERKISPELGFLVWWPKILTKEIISIADFGFINTHPSLLPYARGKNYNFWTLVNDEPFGISCHFIDKKIDSRSLIMQKKIAKDWVSKIIQSDYALEKIVNLSVNYRKDTLNRSYRDIFCAFNVVFRIKRQFSAS